MVLKERLHKQEDKQYFSPLYQCVEESQKFDHYYSRVGLVIQYNNCIEDKDEEVWVQNTAEWKCMPKGLMMRIEWSIFIYYFLFLYIWFVLHYIAHYLIILGHFDKESKL